MVVIKIIIIMIIKIKNVSLNYITNKILHYANKSYKKSIYFKFTKELIIR
jgi:hypothetical protein